MDVRSRSLVALFSPFWIKAWRPQFTCWVTDRASAYQFIKHEHVKMSALMAHLTNNDGVNFKMSQWSPVWWRRSSARLFLHPLLLSPCPRGSHSVITCNFTPNRNTTKDISFTLSASSLKELNCTCMVPVRVKSDSISFSARIRLLCNGCFFSDHKKIPFPSLHN